MGQKSRAWTIANFSKKELRRAVESASYAAGPYPRIEKKGGDSSLLVFALNLGKVLAAKHKDEEGHPAPLDPAFFDNALANRDSHSGLSRHAAGHPPPDRNSRGEGRSVSGRVVSGVCRMFTKTTTRK